MITRDQYLTIMPYSTKRIDAFIAPLETAMDKYEINTPQRQAMFLAQLAHESAELRYMEEIWGPTVAQLGYEGRRDLGNTQPGDGKFFKGHGPIQVTGRAMHQKVSQALFGDDRLLTDPTILCRPEEGCLSAAWLWAVEKKLNEVADGNDTASFLITTKRINGGTNGWASRQGYWQRGRVVLLAA